MAASKQHEHQSEYDARPRFPVTSARTLLAWAVLLFIIFNMVVALAWITPLWWLVFVFGALAAIALATPSIIRARAAARRAPAPAPEIDNERQLLELLARSGSVTPTTVALRTKLTLDEAANLLDDLAARGYVQAHADGGTMVYALFEPDRQTMLRAPETPLAARASAATERASPPTQPLSERELEVLRLVAAGLTNAEIGRELFVATGTVKAHVNNICHKLDVRNRVAAIERARELGLLP